MLIDEKRKHSTKDLLNFIERNKLEELDVQTMWVEGLAWSFYLDEKHTQEIEYNWYYDGGTSVLFKKWGESDDGDLSSKYDTITEEKALEIRGLL